MRQNTIFLLAVGFISIVMWAINCSIGVPGNESSSGGQGGTAYQSVPSHQLFVNNSLSLHNSKKKTARPGVAPSSTIFKTINNTGSDTKKPLHGTHAYVWLIGGIDASTRAHEGLLWGVLVAARLLRSYGSSADFVLYARLSFASSVAEGGVTLPPVDARLLRAAGIKTIMIDPPEGEEEDTFAGIVYEKFRPLSLLEYQRVMFLDSDIMPAVNLDYLFRLTEGPHPVLAKNFFYATRGEPCNTAIFIMTPEEGALDDLQSIIHRQHEEGSRMDYPHFDFGRGWGHNFREANDTWEALHKWGQMWRFHAGKQLLISCLGIPQFSVLTLALLAGHSDQGLWYYYVKYHRMEGSIAIGSRLQTIKPGKDGRPVLINEDGVLAKYAPVPAVDFYDCEKVGVKGNHMCHPGYRDFVHFNGSKKPWLEAPCKSCDKKKYESNPLGFWHKALSEMNDEYDMGLDTNNYAEAVLPRLAHSPLGYVAQHSDHAKLALKRTAVVTDINKLGSGGGRNERPLGQIVSAVHEEGKLLLGASPHTVSIHTSSIPIPESLSGGALLDPMTVAYAVSFIKCGDFQTHSAGLIDASLVLRHSVHKISRRDATSGSKYDYKMYAIVHRDAEECSGVLRDVGFEVVVVDPPVKQENIRGEFLRKNIHREWCCGADEFIKLFAYTLPAEIIVHVSVFFVWL